MAIKLQAALLTKLLHTQLPPGCTTDTYVKQFIDSEAVSFHNGMCNELLLNYEIHTDYSTYGQVIY